RRLHQQILHRDRALDQHPATPGPAGSAARRATAALASATGAASDQHHRRPLPAQLPPAAPAFVGRAPQLATLHALLAEPRTGPAIASIVGPAGVGRTTLAVHWAHTVAERFPDGQLYVNLRGFDPAGQPADPAV